MLAEDLIKQGKVDEALAALEAEVRKNPADSKLRVFLFQILCIKGDWERALNQLAVAGEMDPMAMLMVQTCQSAISCERLREQVFAGGKSPLIFGEPADWIAKMVQAAGMDARGDSAAAAKLREGAFEAAPTTGGVIEVGPEDDKVEKHEFEWIADSDSRLGPMIEAIVDGKYYWIPFERIRLIRIEKPVDLRDAVWTPCQFVWTTGAQGVGFIPTRYPGTQAKGNSDALRLARATEFDADGTPRGHRVWTTDAGEYNLLQVRAIRLNASIVEGS